MNREKYLKDRQALLDLSNTLIEEGKIEEANAKMKEVEELDNKFEAACTAQANINALKERTVVTNLADKSTPVAGPVVATFAPVEPKQDEGKVYLNAFAKTLLGRKLTEEENNVFKSVNEDVKFENSLSTSGLHAVIPETLMKGIWKEMGESHPVLAEIPATFITGEVTYDKETDSGDDAEWEDEEDEAESGEVTIGQLKLTGCELDKCITVNWKLKKMAISEFLPYIQTNLSEKMGNALAKSVFEGKGKPGEGDTFKAQPKGVNIEMEEEEDVPQIVTYGTSDPLAYKKFTAARGCIKSGYANGAKWYMKASTLWNHVANILDNEGKPMFIPSPTSDKTVGYILGLPVAEEDGVNDEEITLGNFAKGYKMNWNETATMYTEDHVKQKKTDYMEYAIVDGGPITTKAFALIKKS